MSASAMSLADDIEGGSGADTLNGTVGDDDIWGYAGNDILRGYGGNDNLYGGSGADILDGGAGLNWTTYVTSQSAVFVDLRSGTGSGGDAQGDRLFNIQDVDGSDYNDTIHGSDERNWLYGGYGDDKLFGEGGDDNLSGGIEGNGSDVLDGGLGADTASFLFFGYPPRVGVQADLSTGIASFGDGKDDTMISIENLVGTNFADILKGNAAANVLDGADGRDTLSGGAGADTLNGGEGSDFLNGGAGADVLIGGGAADTIVYDGPAGVTVDLTTLIASGGDAAGDTIGNDIENIRGTAGFGDVLTGSATANVLSGSGGSDVLNGMGGSDTLDGGAGNDRLRGGAGIDALYGGTGIDTANYDGGSAGVSVSINTGLCTGGDAQGDTLDSVENLSGSQWSDRLAGNGGVNALQGGGGDDSLIGLGGADSLTGGTGADHFVYMNTIDSVIGAGADRITDFSHAQQDRIDLRMIDANVVVPGDQAFTFIGSGLYTGVAGQLRYAVNNGVTTIAGDVNGDKVSDFHIQLTGSIMLTSSDFVL
ncbi:calcium-binding protein [Inquilinus limosus]|nr:calcium-binding protein [Inquilinus limosus]